MSDQPLNLLKKLNKITEELPLLTKDGHNDHHHYDYVKESQVIQVIKPLLIKNNINLAQTELDVFNPKDKLTRVLYQFTLTDLDSGEQSITNLSGEGYDSNDKGTFKANTGALKYFLMRTFLIATGDDPENESKSSKESESSQSSSVSTDGVKRSTRMRRRAL